MKMRLLILFLALVSCLSAEFKILAFAGSTRKDSYNKKLVQEAARIATEIGATVTVIDLKDYPMPFYDGDLEEKEGMPKNAKRLRDLMSASDGIIISTPQYNASIPAVLKNAIDWVSRDKSRAAFEGKKFALMSASPGKKGGTKALEHLRVVIEDCHGTVVSAELSLPFSHQAFNERGQLQNAEAKQKLTKEIKALVGS